MSKFTPGKWWIEPLTSTKEIILAPSQTKGRSREIVAMSILNKANARLIAAAPEMYQHLKLILNGEFSSDDVEQLLARIDGDE